MQINGGCAADRGDPAAAGRRARTPGPRRRPRRRCYHARPPAARRPDHDRHGRHELRRLPDPGRPRRRARATSASTSQPVGVAGRRGPLGRRRRRQRSPGSTPAARSASARAAPAPGPGPPATALGGDGADRDRRERRPRLPRPRTPSSAAAARCAPTSRAAAIETHVGGPLGLDAVEAAAGIIRVVNANMVAAIRAVSVERGIDPRALHARLGGGAGGLHATRARPRRSASRRCSSRARRARFCAFGMTVTDVRHDHARAAARPDRRARPRPRCDALYAELEDEARAAPAPRTASRDERDPPRARRSTRATRARCTS